MKKIIIIMLFLVFFSELWGQRSKLKIIQVGWLDLKKIISFVGDNITVKSKLLGVEKDVTEEIKKIRENIFFLEEQAIAEGIFEDEKKDLEAQIDFEKRKLNELLEGNLDEDSLDVLESERLTPEIVRGIYRTIQEVAVKNGYSIVLERDQGVIYANEDANITPLVIEKLEN